MSYDVLKSPFLNQPRNQRIEEEQYSLFAYEGRKVLHVRMKYSVPKPRSKAKNEGLMESKLALLNGIEDGYHYIFRRDSGYPWFLQMIASVCCFGFISM